MSKQNHKPSSTFFNESRKNMAKTPHRNEVAMRRTQPKSFDGRKKGGQQQYLHELIPYEKDERYQYLTKKGNLKKIEKEGNIIFAEMPKVVNTWVCYRRPAQREANPDKLNLDGLELNHVPLLQGEEHLKMLTFQHNKITKIDNLVSLPGLLYLDLCDNLIKEIGNIDIPSIKVLLLGKNQVARIKNIKQLMRLEVLDLQINRITKIEGFTAHNSLRKLNLSNNQITKIQNLDYLVHLNELNLQCNLIAIIQGVVKLTKLEKLLVASNKIEIKQFQTSELTKLPILKEITVQNNPCCLNMTAFLKNITKFIPSLKLIDGKSPSQMAQLHLQSEQAEDHEKVLKLIVNQWKQEKHRIAQVQASNGGKKQLIKSTCITGGHAQIQDGTIIFIYGNSYDVVLSNPAFQEVVEKISFWYIFIEFLLEPTILATLKKFKKLKIIEFKDCYIMSLLQIARLESLTSLRIINIDQKGNPIAHCTFLKQFIIYRFPDVVQVNREDIKDSDRNRAKILFQYFDKALLIPQKQAGGEFKRNYPSEQPTTKKDKNYLRQFNKTVAEGADQIVHAAAKKYESASELKRSVDDIYNHFLGQLISKARVHC